VCLKLLSGYLLLRFCLNPEYRCALWLLRVSYRNRLLPQILGCIQLHFTAVWANKNIHRNHPLAQFTPFANQQFYAAAGSADPEFRCVDELGVASTATASTYVCTHCFLTLLVLIWYVNKKFCRIRAACTLPF